MIKRSGVVKLFACSFVLAAAQSLPAPVQAQSTDPCYSMVYTMCAARWQRLGFQSQAQCVTQLGAEECGGSLMPGGGNDPYDAPPPGRSPDGPRCYPVVVRAGGGDC